MSDTLDSRRDDDGGEQALDYRHGEYGLQPLDWNKPTLQQGSSDAGHKVRYLQGVLKNNAGASLDLSGNGYGKFGPQTEQAVKNLQARFGVTANGIVGWDGPDGRTPGANATWTIIDKLASGAPDTTPPGGSQVAPPTPSLTDITPTPEHGALAAATAAYRAGFRGDDLATITMIAGRESKWRSDSVNPHTSDRGMWQINWNTLELAPNDALRARLNINRDTDLLVLDTNAAVAWQMYQDSIKQGRPWHPWRGSDTGWKGNGPGWDGNGDHLWRTETHAAESRAAAQAVLQGNGTPAPSTPAPSTPAPSTPAPGGGPAKTAGRVRGSYTIGSADADGFVAVVSRCVGLTGSPWSLRRGAALAVAQHNNVALEAVWHPGDAVRFPPTIPGVRCYTVKAGDGLIAIANGLGLGRDAPAQARLKAINLWQGATPHPGDTWYGGAA
jgi:peptidoglycan hydrolase-like protein with peptidoglycan-binding domain